MGKFSNSFVRGLGFGLGRGLSNELIRDAKYLSTKKTFLGLSTKAQLLTILFWILLFFPIGYFGGIVYNMLWFLFGLIPSIILFRIFYRN